MQLNVKDNYQGGEIRTVKNLSGGEKFIVSLALVFALSKLTSQKVPVESFFIDEGYGTLDENSRLKVLEALGKLSGEGKMIGVISHMPQVKGSFVTRIEI